MTPLIWFEYVAASAGGLFCVLLVLFVFGCAWLFIVGGGAKGREQ